MLSNRAFNELEDRLEKSPFQEDIFVMNTIHDAIYYLVRAKPEAVKWLNDNLIECMNWNEHPLIKSDLVPLEAELDVGLSWDKQETLKNNLSLEEVTQFLQEHHFI